MLRQSIDIAEGLINAGSSAPTCGQEGIANDDDTSSSVTPNTYEVDRANGHRPLRYYGAKEPPEVWHELLYRARRVLAKALAPCVVHLAIDPEAGAHLFAYRKDNKKRSPIGGTFKVPDRRREEKVRSGGGQVESPRRWESARYGLTNLSCHDGDAVTWGRRQMR